VTGRWIVVTAVYVFFVALIVIIVRGHGNLMYDFGVLQGHLDCIAHDIGRLREALPKQ
jgi:hypothetical protein